MQRGENESTAGRRFASPRTLIAVVILVVLSGGAIVGSSTLLKRPSQPASGLQLSITSSTMLGSPRNLIVILVDFDLHNSEPQSVTLDDISYALYGNGEEFDAGYINGYAAPQVSIPAGGDHSFNYTFTAELSDTGLDVPSVPTMSWTLSGDLYASTSQGNETFSYSMGFNP